ncbi:hypothetical protein SBRY_70109 [Actinacidiphila bryophytorum]|uniref:Uncharacterized protein n=1 Tax=Actinacidiphila bryophytorum TaxID=1436133 RepID=A0A9W4H724_9ACTN|nr:hypothetical protein SBRY_70109 [Actinacidiphila bryophytorum]
MDRAPGGRPALGHQTLPAPGRRRHGTGLRGAAQHRARPAADRLHRTARHRGVRAAATPAGGRPPGPDRRLTPRRPPKYGQLPSGATEMAANVCHGVIPRKELPLPGSRSGPTRR